MKVFIQLFSLPVLLVFILIATLTVCKRSQTDTAGPTTFGLPLPHAQYVGRQICSECHEKEFNLFLGSDHDHAMDHAGDSTVLGNFNNVEFTHFGITSRFYRKDDKYFVYTEGPEGRMGEYEIMYTFGIRPLQQYLVEFPGGRLQCLPIAWDTRPSANGGQRWFHLYGNERIEPDDMLYWTRVTQNWNYMCAECHSTNLRKNYHYEEKAYYTTWSEIDVSCEACHGPCSEHVKWAGVVEAGGDPESFPGLGLTIRLKDTDNATWIFDPGSATARRSVPRQSDRLVQMCSRCHSRRSAVTEDYFHGGSLLNTHWPSLLEEGLYFPDGQILDEVYVYGSFLQSKMVTAGVICKDCHEPHSGKVYVPGNALCYRCHMASEYGTREHHFHDPAQEGALCYECHMHERTYMVVDPRRDHSIRIPRPDLSDRLGTPNSCNQCHTGESTAWAAKYFKEWYGDDMIKTRHYGETFRAARKSYPEAQVELIQLAVNRDNPPMVRANAVALLNNYPDRTTTDLLKITIADRDPLIRFATLNVIRFCDPETIRDFCLPRLNDSIKMVRLLAANALSSVPSELIPKSYNVPVRKTLEEYKASLMINADHPGTHLNLGNLYINLGDYERAESSYKEAIEIEPGLVEPYINLADLYRRLGREDEGKILLENALEIYPNLAPVHYALGLLLVRQGNNDDAMPHIQLAAELAPEDPHYSYVYAVALNSMGWPAEAIKFLESALKQHPYDRNILYTLSTLNLESGSPDSALSYAEKLVAYYPEDRNYQQLLDILQKQQN
ncbi:MAG TPA: tetratricopeptide repeat protein [Bacteroidaceae bacterium]|nr:tetratricopeptide repeat protein [Bacteroidaceae bacterium]